MDNQLIQSPREIPKFIVIVFALATIILMSILGIHWHQDSDPYIQQVLSLEGNVNNGHDIFQINCSGCHAFQTHGSGSVGPSLKNIAKRKSKVDLIQQVISGKTPPMPKFQPSPQEMADLLNYLETLD